MGKEENEGEEESVEIRMEVWLEIRRRRRCSSWRLDSYG